MVEPNRKPTRRLSARDYVIFLLGRREYSEKELRQKLKFRECTPEETEEALCFVKETGIQCDARYAGSRSRLDSKRKGDRSIRHGLASQGIDQAIIAEKLSELAPEGERVRQVIQRFYDKSFDLKLKDKVWRFLVSRGFSMAAVKEGLAHLEQRSKGQADA